jgi:hypothetical protein
MRFAMPHYPCEFEIPDDWLAETGAIGFEPPTSAYHSTPAAVLIALTLIEPPLRLVTVPRDWRGFDRERLLSLLKGFVAGAAIEPVPLLELPVLELGSSPYRYRVLDGVHRFYGSIAAGFTYLPAAIIR